VADTIKVQWNGYLGKGKLLLSDMGRVLMSILQDTCATRTLTRSLRSSSGRTASAA
jgi:uncharacterized protein YcgI (DUF1989 family)